MIDTWLLERLACPRCHGSLVDETSHLRCREDHSYPISDGVPIMVLDDVPQTHWVANVALEHRDEISRMAAVPTAPGEIDPVVMRGIGATSGNLYGHLIGKLPRYPIPTLRLEAPAGSACLDLGCHWGRWCVSAARKGWRVVGLDPSFEAVLAARRVARTLGVNASYLVGDARFLPFARGTFNVVHSYSVLQHFAEEDVQRCVEEIARILSPGGVSYIQMAQKFGVLNLLQQLRRRFRSPTDFDVRYWASERLRELFSERIGATRLSADGFFSLNAQVADLDLLQPAHRVVVQISDTLRRLTDRFPSLVPFADSVYVHSTKSCK